MDQQELPGFLETAAELRVKGLSEAEARRVSLSSAQPARNHQCPDSADIELMGGVAPGHNKSKRKGRGGNTVRNFKNELEEVEEVDTNIGQSGHHLLKSGLLGPKHMDAAPKMSFVRRMSMIRNPTGRVAKVNKRYEEVEISDEEGSVRAKEVSNMGQKGTQRAQVDLQRFKVEVEETSGVRRTRRFHCKKPGCAETFPKKTALMKHIGEDHAVHRSRRFHCKKPGCYETFPKKVALKLHMQEVHVQDQSASSGTINALSANSGVPVKKTRRFHCKKTGCSETFPKKTALWLHTEEVHMPVELQECEASPGTNSTMPADSGAQVKRTRRFHCKKMGCSETFPKKAALVQHMEENHTEKAAPSATDKESIQKFKMAVKTALSHALPKKHREEIRAGKAGLERPQNKESGGQYYHQEASHGESEDSTGTQKSEVSSQGQVVMMVWAGNDGEGDIVRSLVENQGVAAEVESPSSPSA